MNFSIWLGATFPELPPEVALEAIAVLITPDGVLGTIRPKNAQTFELVELQRAVNGYIEVVPFNYGYIVLDEEGKLKRAPVNKAATYFLRDLIRPGDYLAGNVLICKKGALV